MNGSAAVFIRRTWNYGSEGHAVLRRGCRPGPRGVWAVAPAVSTPHCLRATRQDLPCTSPGEPRTPAGSPVRAPRWSSAEVFSRHQRGGREGERPRRCRPRADIIRAGVRSKAHRFAVAGRAGCTGSRSVAVTAGHQGDKRTVGTAGDKGWRVRVNNPETPSTRAMRTWRTVHAGARAPVPRLYGSGRPAFSPPTVLRGRGRIFPAPAWGTPHPNPGH